MHGGRVIIENVLSRNRDGIIDLHDLEPSNSIKYQRQKEEGNHSSPYSRLKRRNPPLPDMLSAVAKGITLSTLQLL
jgi:hypothetical protein